MVLGLYILMISVTGSVLVYSNELYRAATPEPIPSKASGPRLTDDQLSKAATRSKSTAQTAIRNRRVGASLLAASLMRRAVLQSWSAP